MNCQADRLPIYEHAREVAAVLAQRVQPVPVAEAVPLEIAEASAEQPSPLYLAKLPRVGDATNRAAKKNGRPAIMEQRASTIERHRANGEPYWIAQVRGANNARTYLGPHRTREHALAACEQFITRGEKPPGAKRGRKVGQQQQGTRRKPVTPKQSAKEPISSGVGRIEMMKRIWARIA